MREEPERIEPERIEPGRAGAGGAILMHPALRRLRERFPLLQETATERFFGDEAFREMCEDYDACAQSLALFQSRPQPPEDLLAEYTALLLRLERELLRHLEGPTSRGES